VVIPPDHPRRESLLQREKITEGVKDGVVVLQGLIAHGRGECFDYLIGEETRGFALEAMEAAGAAMLLAERPVISVNGNVAVLVPDYVVELARETGALIEVNLFYRSRDREEKIAEILRERGAGEVLGVGDDASCTIPELSSERRRVSCRGIYIADVVLVPLEDGDRTEALKRMGKKVIAVDLNPLSRTARAADITIVDNVVRAMPKMVEIIKQLKYKNKNYLKEILNKYNNKEILRKALLYIKNRLEDLARGEGYL